MIAPSLLSLFVLSQENNCFLFSKVTYFWKEINNNLALLFSKETYFCVQKKKSVVAFRLCLKAYPAPAPKETSPSMTSISPVPSATGSRPATSRKTTVPTWTFQTTISIGRETTVRRAVTTQDRTPTTPWGISTGITRLSRRRVREWKGIMRTLYRRRYREMTGA